LRPTLRLLSDELIRQILAEAYDILEHLGVEVHNPGLLDLLAEHGARVDRATNRAFLPEPLVRRALSTSPRSFKLFDTLGNETHDFSGANVYFTPGSAALNVLDSETGAIRRPATADNV